MKKLAIFTLFGYIALALFGFTGMYEHSPFNACLRTAFPAGMPCAGSSSSDTANAQAGIYHAFSTGTAFTLALLFALIAVATATLKLAEQAKLPLAGVYFSTSRRDTPAHQKLTDWFTVFQKRDPSGV